MRQWMSAAPRRGPGKWQVRLRCTAHAAAEGVTPQPPSEILAHRSVQVLFTAAAAFAAGAALKTYLNPAAAPEPLPDVIQALDKEASKSTATYWGISDPTKPSKPQQ